MLFFIVVSDSHGMFLYHLLFLQFKCWNVHRRPGDKKKGGGVRAEPSSRILWQSNNCPELSQLLPRIVERNHPNPQLTVPQDPPVSSCKALWATVIFFCQKKKLFKLVLSGRPIFLRQRSFFPDPGVDSPSQIPPAFKPSVSHSTPHESCFLLIQTR